MTVAAAQETHPHEHAVETSCLPLEAIVYNVGAEMIRSRQTSAEIELTRDEYRRIGREKNLLCLGEELLQEFPVLANDVYVSAIKKTSSVSAIRRTTARGDDAPAVRYFIRFGIEVDPDS